MRKISVLKIKDEIRQACESLVCDYPPDVLEALKSGYESEERANSRKVIEMLQKNAEIAKEERLPICQDTGMVSVYLTVGQEVCFIDGSLKEAINQGVKEGYEKYLLRKSMVKDPLFERINTKDNTPALIFIEMTEGDKCYLELTAKGFGSENMSRLKMLKPSDGVNGVKEFVLDTVKRAGPNACPPIVVGIGIGGSFDYAPYLAKKALLRDLHSSNPNERYKALEDELLMEINKLDIGPLGLKGKTTALKVMIEEYPTHIAGLPCAISICCHVLRHIRLEF